MQRVAAGGVGGISSGDGREQRRRALGTGGRHLGELWRRRRRAARHLRLGWRGYRRRYRRGYRRRYRRYWQGHPYQCGPGTGRYCRGCWQGGGRVGYPVRGAAFFGWWWGAPPGGRRRRRATAVRGAIALRQHGRRQHGASRWWREARRRRRRQRRLSISRLAFPAHAARQPEIVRGQARLRHHHVLQPLHPEADSVDGEYPIPNAHAVLGGGLGAGGHDVLIGEGQAEHLIAPP